MKVSWMKPRPLWRKSPPWTRKISRPWLLRWSCWISAGKPTGRVNCWPGSWRSIPESAYLQHALGIWLLNHGQTEYALLGLAKAVELEPDNSDYRYKLAIALHDLDQLEAAQRQLEELLQRQPANRKARVLLIRYWKESGQIQNVQVLLAQMEQLNRMTRRCSRGFDPLCLSVPVGTSLLASF